MIRFSLIGPLRTGSSLLTRCLDDHPGLICLCESEINRTLFGDYFVRLHFQRMRKHGLAPLEIVELLDRKRQNSTEDYERWHREARAILAERFGKKEVAGIGDKSPDFYRTPELADHVGRNHRLIYTVRDPRAVYRSIQSDETPTIEKERRWKSFLDNVEFWKDGIRQPNVLTVQYERLLSNPEEELRSVFAHLGVPYSSAYRESFPRAFPERFLWKGVTEQAEEGVSFARDNARLWESELSRETIEEIESDSRVREFMDRFGYPEFSG